MPTASTFAPSTLKCSFEGLMEWCWHSHKVCMLLHEPGMDLVTEAIVVFGGGSIGKYIQA